MFQTMPAEYWECSWFRLFLWGDDRFKDW